jgi:hypothetical protein
MLNNKKCIIAFEELMWPLVFVHVQISDRLAGFSSLCETGKKEEIMKKL